LCRKELVVPVLAKKELEVVVVLGAGDLDNYMPEILKMMIKE